MIRFLAFFGIILLVIYAPWWLLLPVALGYSFYFHGYELIILAGCIDAYYGTQFDLIPYYTISVTLIVALVELSRPSLNLRSTIGS